MTWKQSNYDEIKTAIQPGDVIAFAGKDGISGSIMAATKGPIRHVGVVLRSSQDAEGASTDKAFATGASPQVIESGAELNEYYGVKLRWLDERVPNYDGSIWWLPLSDAVRTRLDLEKFRAFLLEKENLPFDVLQAIGSASDDLDQIPVIGDFTRNQEEFSAFFCSELVTAGLEAGGLIQSINCSEVTPLDLAQFAIYEGTYYQLKGPRTLIPGYNTLDPEGWGQPQPGPNSGAPAYFQIAP